MAGRLQRFRALAVANLRVSPVKSGILLTGALVLAGLLIRQLAGGPSTADAEPPVVVAVPARPIGGRTVDAAAAAGSAARKPPKPPLPGIVARDPFALQWMELTASLSRATADESNAVDLALQMTLCASAPADETRALAVISGTVVRHGATLNGYTVERIDDRQVKLRHGEEVVTLQMP